MTRRRKPKSRNRPVPKRPCDFPRMPSFERRFPPPRPLPFTRRDSPAFEAIASLEERIVTPRCPACHAVLRFQIDFQGVYFRCLCSVHKQRLNPR
jgi:hypothetical protein